MKKILIVDDEKPARELLKMALDWQRFGFDPPEEAINGMQALGKYQQMHPDIIITDIQMPGMDGLELIEAIRKINKQQRIVILSCHESFSYAKRAIHLGVADYLIKDELNPQELAELLLRPSATQVQESMFAVQTPILYPLSRGQITGTEASRRLQAIIPAKMEYCCCYICGAAIFSGQIQQIQDVLLQEYGGDIYQTETGELSVLLFLPIHISKMEDLNEKTRRIGQLRAILERDATGLYTIGVSNNAREGTVLEQCLQQAQLAARCAVFYGAGRTIYHDQQQTRTQNNAREMMNNRLHRIIEAVDQLDYATVSAELTTLYRKDLPGMMQINYLHHINTLLLTSLTSRCIQQKIPFVQVFQTDTLSAMPDGCNTVEEMLQWYLGLFKRYFEQISHRTQYLLSPKVYKVSLYIEEHLDEDLTLEILAEHFNMHKVYLAKIFKKELGCSVNMYIRTAKTTRAKELLADPSLKINHIAQELGFHSTQTFYNVFKSCAGISPSEFREQILG